MLTWEYEIKDPQGLHARPVSQLVMQAMKYKSSIQMSCRRNCADGKNILELLALGARKNDTITVHIQGEDEVMTLEAIKQTLMQMDDLNP